MLSEKQFLDELNIFYNEVMLALGFFYTELAIRGIISKSKLTHEALNYSPNFWNIILNSLQHSALITLGRIFDEGSNNHSIFSLLRIAEKNINLFTKKSFEDRWIKSRDRSGINDWLPEYLKTVWVPTINNFREFRKFIAKHKKIYDDIYRPIRHQFGHKIYSKNEDVKALFSKIQIRDLEKMCVLLKSIHEVLWQLYHNGRGPLLPIGQRRYSTRKMLKKRVKQYNSESANTQFIKEAATALNLLKLGKLAVNKKRRAVRI